MEETKTLDITDRTWEAIVDKSGNPVMVMFYSPECPYCRSMDPYFSQLSGEYAGVVTFARIDIVANQWTAERYAIRSTPTFRFFCSGRPVSELIGAVYPALLKRMVDEGITSGKECAQNRTQINYDITGYG
jgi:thioredoxin-like negative regulator of GroEL